jgi:hypothetical protein
MCTTMTDTDGQKKFSSCSLLLLPAERATQFAGLSDRKPFADVRTPEVRVLLVKNGFNKTFLNPYGNNPTMTS